MAGSTHLPTVKVRLLASLLAGLIGGVVVGWLWSWWLAPIVAWDIAALWYVVWLWLSIGGLTATQTSEHSLREDPGVALADSLLVLASVASLLVVGILMIWAAGSDGWLRSELVGLSIVSILLSWCVVHTVFALRYARLYYANQPGGIDFNQSKPPRYADFAYIAFTIGMTFQVSDTSISSSDIRAQALRHALLAYLFGTVIVATTINLVVSLGK